MLWRLSGVIGVATVWIGISTLMFVGHLKLIDPRPVSYLGVNPSTQVAFSGVLLVSAVLFVGFAFYLAMRLRAGFLFLLFFLVGQIGQVISGLVPIGSETRFGQIHTPAAFTLAFSFPLLITAFTISQLKSPGRRLYMFLLSFELITFTIGIGSFIFTKGVAPLSEILAAIGFHIWIIVVTFTFQKLPQKSNK